MNDLTDLQLLDRHGPEAPPLRDEVRGRARAALLDAIAEHARMPSVGDPEPSGAADVAPLASRRARRTRRAVLLAACAAGVAGVLTLAPGLLGMGETGAVAITAAPRVTFPVSVGAVPEGLGAATYEKDMGFEAARWGDGTTGLSVTVADDSHWDGVPRAGTIDIAGRDADILTGDGSMTLLFTLHGRRVGVTGTGTLADARRLDPVAESVRDEQSPVTLPMTLSPKGWAPAAYKDGRVVTYTPDGELGGADQPSVSVTLGHAPGGLDNATTLTVQGHPARIGTGMDAVVLEGTTATGTPFSVVASTGFTREQVVALAEGVRG